MAQPRRPQSRNGFEIAIICALPIERDAIEGLLDEDYEEDGFSYGKHAMDVNAYTTGRLGNQPVVIAHMPGVGSTRMAAVAANIRFSFKEIKVCFVVGICSGVPTTATGEEIVLGDVIISTSMVEIEPSRQRSNKLALKACLGDTLAGANADILSFFAKVSGRVTIEKIRRNTSVYTAQIVAKESLSKSLYPEPAKDQLYPADHRHKHRQQGSCAVCTDGHELGDVVCEAAPKKPCLDLGCHAQLIGRKRLQTAARIAPNGSGISTAEIKEARKARIHLGRMAVADRALRSGQYRDQIAQHWGVIGFEIERPGTWDYIPTITIKSVCDYADGRKHHDWRDYSAATAAACMKAMLEQWRGADPSIPGEVQLYALTEPS